jgi:NAD(P)-dependent dehydrogenase (short-subunit alcohol dehydrogenase family)
MLRDRVGLVTGAGRGIGRAVAVGLARQGAAVVLVARTGAEVEAVAAEVHAMGGTASVLIADLSDEAMVESIARNVLERHGRVDILVNNAGGSLLGPIATMSTSDWWNQVELNLRAPYLLCRALVPGMVERRWGRVVNMASRLGKIGAPLATSYCSAKHAIIGFTRALALEVAESGVTVNAVCPGHVDTALMTTVFEGRGRVWGISPEAARDRMIQANIPQKHLLVPDDIVPAVLFLVSEGAARITGEAMNVSGGAVMH